jgi:hypothetical protein
VNQASAS